MEKQLWEVIVRPVVEEVLQNAARYKGEERCFLTAYQIATLVNASRPEIEREYATGGRSAGHATLAQRIALYLSNDAYFEGRIERRFLSTQGLDSFEFDGSNVPSTDEFSMYRLLD